MCTNSNRFSTKPKKLILKFMRQNTAENSQCKLFIFKFFSTVSWPNWCTLIKQHIFKVCNLINSDICTHSWNHHQNQDNKHFYHPWRFTCDLDVYILPHSIPLHTTTDVLSVTMDYFAFFRIVFKWKPRVCALFCLPSFTQHNFEIHPYCFIY